MQILLARWTDIRHLNDVHNFIILYVFYINRIFCVSLSVCETLVTCWNFNDSHKQQKQKENKLNKQYTYIYLFYFVIVYNYFCKFYCKKIYFLLSKTTSGSLRHKQKQSNFKQNVRFIEQVKI